MKVTPVSADMLLKIGLAVVGVGVAVWAVNRVTNAASDAAGAAWDWAGTNLNPWSRENVAYQTVNNAIWPDGGETVGTWAQGVVQSASDWLKKPKSDTSADFVGPPDYLAPQNTTGTTGSGGAAFGIYPRR